MEATTLRPEVILGPPGTGKTETLIRFVEDRLADGVPPARIAYLAFTRRAANEARARAQAKFSFTDDDMPWYRTIHSLAFKQIGAKRDTVMDRPDYKEVTTRAGFSYTGKIVMEEDDLYEMGYGDGLIYLDNLARIRMMTLEDMWGTLGERIHSSYLLADVLEYRAKLLTYKESVAKIDFTDFLETYIAIGAPPPVDHVIVDEAQDLSRLQWAAVSKIIANASRVIYAGDSDQAIYCWAGADVSYFQTQATTGDLTILDQSHRVPKRIWQLSQGIIHRVKNRIEQPYLPKEELGEIKWIYDDAELDASKGSWLFLCRHRHQLRDMKATCRRKGWFFTCEEYASNQTKAARAILTWENLRRGTAVSVSEALQVLWFAGEDAAVEKLKIAYDHEREIVSASTLTMITGVSFTEPWLKDAARKLPRMDSAEEEYFVQARRAGEHLASKDDQGILVPAEPRIRISTIHGSKGAQAEGVYLLVDLSESAYRSLYVEDDEHRTFYVAVTRAEKILVMQHPLELYSYEMPEIE